MFDWKNIVIGLAIALTLSLIMLFAYGSSEIFIYNRF